MKGRTAFLIYHSLQGSWAFYPILSCVWGIKELFHCIENCSLSLNRNEREIKSSCTFSWVGHVEIVSAVIYMHQSYLRGSRNNICHAEMVGDPPLSSLLIPRAERVCHQPPYLHSLWLRDWLQAGTVRGRDMIPSRRDLHGDSRPLIQLGPGETSQCITSPKTPCGRRKPSLPGTSLEVCVWQNRVFYW